MRVLRVFAIASFLTNSYNEHKWTVSKFAFGSKAIALCDAVGHRNGSYHDHHDTRKAAKPVVCRNRLDSAEKKSHTKSHMKLHKLHKSQSIAFSATIKVGCDSWLRFVVVAILVYLKALSTFGILDRFADILQHVWNCWKDFCSAFKPSEDKASYVVKTAAPRIEGYVFLYFFGRQNGSPWQGKMI